MPPPDADETARAWLRKAAGDRDAARACLDSGRVPAWISGFHLQQAVEKALKGLLVLAGREPPRTHLLRKLHDLIEQAGESPPVDAERIKLLQPFATEERYPLLIPSDATDDEVRPLLAVAEAAVEALANRLAPPPQTAGGSSAERDETGPGK